MLKIVDLSEVPSNPMDGGRGTKQRLVDAADGTQTLDVHMNTLAPGGPRGKLHKHSVADNVYIVRSGTGEFVVEGKTYRVKKDQIVFIPAGLRHSLSNVSDEPFEIFEIYAPAGAQFDFIVCE
jgi:mannose-6-phosphate isomerase-like protein (cupin superfamily)